MSPRPILKRASSTAPNHPAQAVHFPPSCSLSATFSAYSASAYDRSPIKVSPNACALPERGGRTYLLDEQAIPTPRGIAYARDYHPRALAFASSSYAQVPPLIPDLSSESDESDGNLPGELCASTSAYPFGPHGLATPPTMNSNGYFPIDDNTDDDSRALRFIPYASNSSFSSPVSSTSSPSRYAQDSTHDLQNHKVRPRSERRFDSSRDPDRIPRCPGGDLSLAISSLSISPPSPTPTRKSGSSMRKKGVRSSIQVHLPPNATGFGCGALDDSCLGGF